MSGDSRRGSWGSYPDRARLPPGYSQAGTKRSQGRPVSGAYQQEQSRSRVPQSEFGRRRGGPPPRAVAVFALVVTAVIIAVAGIAVTSAAGSSGASAAIPVSLLPFSPTTVSTAGQ